MKLGMPKALSVVTLLVAVASTQLTAQSTKKSQATSPEKTLTGVVSDAMCGRTHMVKNKTAAECTRICVQQGQKYALVVGQKVYTLQGHEDGLNKFAGQRVTIRGTVSGDTVTVSSVAAANKKGTT